MSDEREQTFHFEFNGQEIVTVIDYEAPDRCAPVRERCDPRNYHMGAVMIEDPEEHSKEDLEEIAIIARDAWKEMVEVSCCGWGE